MVNTMRGRAKPNQSVPREERARLGDQVISRRKHRVRTSYLPSISLLSRIAAAAIRASVCRTSDEDECAHVGSRSCWCPFRRSSSRRRQHSVGLTLARRRVANDDSSWAIRRRGGSTRRRTAPASEPRAEAPTWPDDLGFVVLWQPCRSLRC